MKINKLDLLYHKIIVGKSTGGDTRQMDKELNAHVEAGLANKCTDTIDFVNRMEAKFKINKTAKGGLKAYLSFFLNKLGG